MSAVDHLVSPVDVLALQYGNPRRMIGIPLLILGGVVVLTVAVSVAVLRAGGTVAGAQGNGSILWSVLGYTVALGAQNVASSFPFSLALGSSRRAFVLGNLLTAAAQALLVAVASLVLLGIEVATGGWFIGVHVVRSGLTGDGDPLVLGGAMLLGVLMAMSIGGVFAAAWVRFGARGPLGIAIGTTALLVVVLLVLSPIAASVRPAVEAIEPWWVAVLVTAVALVGQYLFLRRASVR
ncbi:hypothetical protein [Amnibacterium kyonggiense]|uniref:Uncharacterized protein n=1 Tax=Amnibacterium kyonggiense TaxID=595671 RepID=A0A4R7FI21_9MICO|nr:hypothetical protein [Amnibacterium kyonggiense]TDS76134.1 hypothetical protein CLV52_3253 [Amnibacterium kyonggiense]